MKKFLFLNKKGAFLMEALIAVVILSSGLVAVIKAFTMGIEAHQRSQEYLIASMLLENKLTGFLIDRYVDENVSMEGVFDEPFSNYSYFVTVDPVDQREFLRKVNVAIKWPGRKGERSADATMYFFVEPTS